MEQGLRDTLSAEQIRYSQVWEDQAVLREALAVQKNEKVLSIASAGCNALSLLTNEPAKLVALDISPAQLALTELKLQGIQWLDYADFLSLMGIQTYQQGLLEQLLPSLSENARLYWQKHAHLIESGLIHCGRLDQFFTRWADQHLSRFLSLDIITGFLKNDPEAEKYVLEKVASNEFVESFKSYFSEENIAAKGRDPAQFKYVTKHALEDGLLARFSNMLTQPERKSNFYLQYLLLGQYQTPTNLPFYAQEAIFQQLKPRVADIELVCFSLEDYLLSQPDGYFDKANLSNIFEYMSEEQTDALLTLLARKMKKGGRIAYWNLFCPRRSSPALQTLWHHETALSEQLHLRDNNWFYSAFHVETRA